MGLASGLSLFELGYNARSQKKEKDFVSDAFLTDKVNTLSVISANRIVVVVVVLFAALVNVNTNSGSELKS